MKQIELERIRAMEAINKKIAQTRKHNSFVKEDRIVP